MEKCHLIQSIVIIDMHTGQLLDVDEQKIVLSLIDKYHHVLIQGQGLPSQLITSFLNAFPEHGLYFQQKWSLFYVLYLGVVCKLFPLKNQGLEMLVQRSRYCYFCYEFWGECVLVSCNSHWFVYLFIYLIVE